MASADPPPLLLILRVTVQAVSWQSPTFGDVPVTAEPRTVLIPVSLPPPGPDGLPQDPVAFGRMLREARESARITQARLAKAAGVTDVTIRNIEHGRHSASPQVRRFLILALAKLAPASSTRKEG